MKFITSFKNLKQKTILSVETGINSLFLRIFGEKGYQKIKDVFAQVRFTIKKIFFGHINKEGKYYKQTKRLYKIGYLLIFIILGAYFQLTSNFLWLTGKMPGIEDLQNPKLNQASSIISADGEVIGKYFLENRTPVDSSEISQWMFDALIYTEDKRFFKHSGIDLSRMVSVAYGIVTRQSEIGGGSTISQQLAKNLYNIRQKEMSGLFHKIPKIGTLINKGKEWITAIQLEKRYTKGEIATLYLNTVDYGNNTYGINTAARYYFDKPPVELNASESAVLVGLQKATTYYNPIRNPENSKKRRNVVLSRLVENGRLDAAEAKELMEQDIELSVNTEVTGDEFGSYFKVALAKQITAWIKENDLGLDIYRDGLKIYTTLDSRMQSYAESAMERHMRTLQRSFDNQWRDQNPWRYENGAEILNYIDVVAQRTNLYQYFENKFNGNKDSIDFYMNKPQPMKFFSWNGPLEVEASPIDSIKYYKRFLQSGMMAFDPYTGFIKAWVGGVDFKHFKYDHVNQAKRQAGSAFKPIVYTAAIDGTLDLSPCDNRQDVMKSYGSWTPRNAGNSYSGNHYSLRNALSRSVNTIAVQLTEEVHPKNVIEYARKMGIDSQFEEDLTLGLGTSDVSLYDLVASYGIFLNEGLYREPILAYRIEDKNGKRIADFRPKERQAVTPESAYLMQYMLRGTVEEPGGTGVRLFNYNSLFRNGGQVGGKTGTTSNNSDGWYVGFTKDLVCGVWVGGDDRSIHFKDGLGEGSRAALPIFGIFMDQVYSDKQLSYTAGPFKKPYFTIAKNYLNCYSVWADSTAVDSLTLELDSIKAYKDRFLLDSTIKMDKIEPLPTIIAKDSTGK